MTEKYITFDLGNNYLYDNDKNNNKEKEYENSLVYSNEYIKLLQIICSEIESILKSISKEIQGDKFNNKNQSNIRIYTEIILNNWNTINSQKVKFKDIELQPFKNWTIPQNPQKSISLDFWISYNNIKHNRLKNYKEANLKNIINALAGLYVLELYFIRDIGNKTNDRYVPDDISKIFYLTNFQTKHTVFGKNNYDATEEEIKEIVNIGWNKR